MDYCFKFDTLWIDLLVTVSAYFMANIKCIRVFLRINWLFIKQLDLYVLKNNFIAIDILNIEKVS